MVVSSERKKSGGRRGGGRGKRGSGDLTKPTVGSQWQQKPRLGTGGRRGGHRRRRGGSEQQEKKVQRDERRQQRKERRWPATEGLRVEEGEAVAEEEEENGELAPPVEMTINTVKRCMRPVPFSPVGCQVTTIHRWGPCPMSCGGQLESSHPRFTVLWVISGE